MITTWNGINLPIKVKFSHKDNLIQPFRQERDTCGGEIPCLTAQWALQKFGFYTEKVNLRRKAHKLSFRQKILLGQWYPFSFSAETSKSTISSTVFQFVEKLWSRKLGIEEVVQRKICICGACNIAFTEAAQMISAANTGKSNFTQTLN